MLKTVSGDATKPLGDGVKIIAHCCNDIGAWGAGFVNAITARWPKVREAYFEYVDSGAAELGSVQFVEAEKDIIIANMIGQKGVGFDSQGYPPIRYFALQKALRLVSEHAQEIGATIHMPKVGSGLAGGYWPFIETLCVTPIAKNTDVTVYEFS